MTAWLVAAPMTARAQMPQPVASPPVQVTGLQLVDQAQGARLAIVMSQRAEPVVFLLDQPRRLVIDFPSLRFALPPAGLPPSPLINGLRFGQFDRATSRLVLDLRETLTVRQMHWDPGQRAQLIIDLDRADPDAFIAAVKATAPPGKGLRPGIGVAATPPPAPAPPPSMVTAAAAPPVAPAVPRALPRREDAKRVIVIDPGHGGIDPGAIGANGSLEKDITLASARSIKRELEASGRYRVVLTRDSDMFMRLRERVAVARAAGAELFLSIHADTLGQAQFRGASVYTLSETASDAEAAALAQRENRADIIAGVDLSQEHPEVATILIDLAQRETMNLSARAAGALVAELGKTVQLLPTNPHRFAGFAVLRAPDTPAVLIELGYLSNRNDEMLLTQPEHRAKVAKAVLRAVDRFFCCQGQLVTSRP